MAIPASVLFYTNWDHGTLASSQFTHAAPNIPSDFVWGTANGSIVQDNNSPWNGQYLFDASANWSHQIGATLSSATIQASSGRLLVEVDQAPISGGILQLLASNSSNGLISVTRNAAGELNVSLDWRGWGSHNEINFGAVPAVPFAVELIYDTQNSTVAQRLRGRIWNIGSAAGSFGTSSGSGSAATTDQFVTLVGSSQENQCIYGRIIISNSTTEDLSAVTIASESDTSVLPVVQYYYNHQR
jgi:hypothetical protein